MDAGSALVCVGDNLMLYGFGAVVVVALVALVIAFVVMKKK